MGDDDFRLKILEIENGSLVLSDSIWLYSSHILLALEKILMSQRLQSAGKVTLLCMCLRNVTRPLYHGCARWHAFC